MTAPLGALPALLRDEPGLTRALGEPDAVSRSSRWRGRSRSRRSPRCRRDGRSWSAARRARWRASSPTTSPSSSRPARSSCSRRWETLPFERVSPSVETMGRRLRRAVAAARPASAAPAVIVAGVRALLQRLGPGVDDVEPIVVAPGARRRPRRARGAGSSSSATGARSRSSTAARSPCAARSSTCSRRPPTPRSASTCGATRSTASPRFGVADQRSTDDLDEVVIFPARELLPTDEVRDRAAGLVGERAVGPRAVGAPGRGRPLRRHGGWLPWLVDERPAAHRPAARRRARWCWSSRAGCATGRTTCSPRRPTSPATLAVDVGARPRQVVPAPARRPRPLLARPTRRPFWSIDSTPESPDTPLVAASGWGPVVGDGDGLTDRLRELLGRGLPRGRRRRRRRARRTPPRPAARRRPRLPGRRDAAPTCRPVAASSSRRWTAAARCRTRRWRSSPRPTSPAGAGPTAPARKRKRERRHFEDLKAGDYVVHHQHGVGRYEGMVKRAIGGVERDYLLLEYKGGDKLYVPSDQIDTRAPVLGRRDARRCTGWAAPTSRRPRARCAPRSARSPRSWSCSTRSGVNAAGHAFAPDTPWQREMEEAFPYEETPDQRTAIDDVKADMERPHPDGPPRVRRRRLRQDRGRDPRRVQGGAGRQAGRGARARPPCSPSSTARRSASASPATRSGSRCCRGSSPPAQAKQVVEGVATGEVDVRHRHPPPARRRREVQGPRPAGRRRGAALRRAAQGGDQEAARPTSTCSRCPPRRSRARSRCRSSASATCRCCNTPPADRQPILTYVGEYDERVAVEAIRRELLREGQVFFVHNRVQDIEHGARAACASSCPRRASRSPTARWTRARSSRSCSTSGRASTTCSSARRSSSRGIDMPDREHARRRPRRPARPRPAPPAARPRRAPGSAGLRLPVPPARQGRSPRRPTSGSRRSASPPSSARASRSPCATSRSAAPATCSARRSPATSPRSATTSTARWSPRRSAS